MCNRWIMTAVLFLTLSGCGEKPELLEAVPLDKLPPGALDTAKKQLPGVKFESARKAKYQGQDAFEIRGKTKEGKIREIEVDTAGKVLEVE